MIRVLASLGFGLAAAMLVAGGAGASQTPAQPGTFTAAWDDEVQEGPIWTGWLSEELESHSAVLLDFVPADFKEYCPAWPRLARHDREQVWITLISSIAKYESSFDPDASFMEPPPLNERSIGLMQLSLSDTLDFACGFTSESEIEDPRNNLDCAARVIALLVLRDGVIGGSPKLEGEGAAAYWSVLNEHGHAKARAFIVGRTNALPACRDAEGPKSKTPAGPS